MPAKKKRPTRQSSRFPDPAKLRESNLASDMQGNNRLHGEDQESVRNERRTMPKVAGATGKADTDGESEEE